MSQSPAIQVEGLVKRYGAFAALAGLDLGVEQGQLLALLGHNGAGKTTLVKLLLGLTRPTAGRIQVLGARPDGRDAVELRRSIGFLPENVTFAGGMTGREALTFFARLKGAAVAEVDQLLARVDLAQAAGGAIKTYSKGMRQRLGLAQALLGKPRLLLLDEPTTGLDPVLRKAFYEILKELQAAGTTILLSSHVLTELELRADRIAILRRGQLVVCDDMDGLRRRAGLPVRIRVRAPGQKAEALAAAMGQPVEAKPVNGRSVELSVQAEGKMSAVRSLAANLGIEDLDIMPPSLDEIYAHFGNGGSEQ